MTIQVTFSGTYSEFIEHTIAALENPSLTEDILDEAQALALNRIRARFLDTQDTNENPWPVSRAALARQKSGRDGKTLFDTGDLFHSIQAFIDDSPVSRTIGSDVPYGKYHQHGTTRLPVREFLGFSKEDVRLIELSAMKRVEDALTEGLQ